jgi:hypothetical protein
MPLAPAERVERIDRLRALVHRPRHVRAIAQLLLDRRHAALGRDALAFQAIVANEEPRGLDHRARLRHAQLHRLKVAHPQSGVVGAALLDCGDRELEGRQRVADAGAGQTVGAEPGSATR